MMNKAPIMSTKEITADEIAFLQKTRSENMEYLTENGPKKNEWLQKLEPYKDLIDPNTAISFLLDECRRNKEILECSPQSILNCLVQASQVGFKISSTIGYAYAIPFKNYNKVTKKTVKELTLVFGYKGFIALMYRMPNVAKINTRIVYQNEIDAGKFQVQYGKDEFLRHVPSFSKEGGAALFYADVTFKDGTYKFQVLSREEGLEARENSKGWIKNPKEDWQVKKNNESAWGKNFDAMVLGKAVRKLFVTVPGFDAIQSIIPFDIEDDFVNNETGEITQKQPKTNSTDTLADDLINLSVDSEIIDVEAETVDTEAHRVKEAD